MICYILLFNYQFHYYIKFIEEIYGHDVSISHSEIKFHHTFHILVLLPI